MIAALAVTLALTAPSREALIQQWLRANPKHSAASLASGPRGAAPAPDLHALAQRELSASGRYQLSTPNAPPATEPWWQRAWDWIAQRWQKFWNAIFARAHVGRETAASIGDVLLVIVGLLLIFVVVRLLRNLQIARSASQAASEPLAEPPTPRALYRAACNAATRSDYASATLLLFAATVAYLDRQGAVRATSSATVGDLRRAVRTANANLLGSFDAVASPFVQTAYAERPIDESQWNHARTAFVTLSGIMSC